MKKPWYVPAFHSAFHSVDKAGADGQSCAPWRAMSRLAKAVVLFVSLIGLGTWGGNAMAAIKTSVAAGGTWSTAATWNPVGVPAAGDTVTIAGPGLVTITGNVTQTAVGSVTVNSGASLSITGGTTIFGALTIANTGTATTSRVLRVLGATNITGTINLSGARANIFTGDVTLNGGAVWNNTTTSVQTFSGNFTNNATTFTATGTGRYTFNGVGKTLSGATAIVHPTVTFSGVGASYTNTGTLTAATLLTVTSPAVLTNNGTITATTALSGTGGVTQGATGVLNIGAASAITTLTAIAAGNVVNYTGGAAQTVKATTYDTLNFSGAGVKTNSGIVTVNTALTGTAMTNAATGTLNIGGTSTLTALTATAAGNIVNYTGAAQTIKATAYDTLNVTGTATNSGTVTAATALGGVGTLTNDATGILNIGGTSLITTLNASTVGNIVNYTGGAAQTVKATTYDTLNFSGAGVKTNSGVVTVNTALTGTAMTNAATGTLNIGGTSTLTTLTATAAGNIVNYTGAGQTVKATTYHHLGLGGSGAKAMGATSINGDFTLSGSATTAPTGALTVGGNFTIGVGTTFTAGALAHSVGGNWNNSGMFTAGTSTITLNGAVPQTIGGTSNTTFNNLTVNNANGVTLNSSPTVSGTLALTDGVVTAGSYTLRSSANCTTGVTVGTGYVAGSVELTFPIGNATCRFPVGSGSVYAPIDLTKPVGSAVGKMTGSTTGNEHPNVASSPVDSSKDVNRYWTLSGDTINAGSYVTTFNFVTGDVDAGADPLGFVLGRYASGAWSEPASPTPSALAITSSLTGPIVGATDFVAGKAGFVCSIPTGSPVGTTCVCDNFNRPSLSPSTIYGGNWNVSTSSGAFGAPLIVNNRLRLTDNTGNVATAATAPGTYPAKGNWITVEFKHYAYNGTGADGIAFTLSDALITAVPGAFGGSLGYAQKTGINGFAGGWVGIGIDEYGNFSSNTEGRTGGAAPGQIIDSVAVRGSGSGQTGYPYLGGTTTPLAPPIDAPAPAVAGLGHAYRLTVDAIGYTWDGATGTKSTLVSVDRDTTGTGTSYTPLVPAFDAYVVNPSQADVPTDWQLSFTGSTGGSTNIHEIIGLKICAQTIVPPAGYRIQVDNMTPTTCPSDPQPTVTISALNANGQVMTTYTNTVNIADTLASGGGGGASSATWVPYGTNQGTWDGVNKRYTFVAGDNGVAKFYLSDLVQQNVYITVSEYLGTLNSSLAAPVYFSSGAASFVVSTPDTLGAGVVAGRAHLMRVSRNTVGCGGGTDVGFNGAKPLDGWYNPAAGEHPTGALAPQICAPVAGACLPYGSCQTLSIAPPVVDSASNNISLTFAAGVADFCLVTSDVGKYSVGLRDDSVATGTPAVTGTSTTLTARPFAVVVSDVKQGATNNPANGTSGGSVFAKAGTAFQSTVGGYLWNSAGDTSSNGLPGAAANWAAITAAGIAPSYADTVALAAVAPFAPAAGVLSNGSVAVASGSTTATTLSYNEVGSFTLTATPATSYLNSGVNLGNRVAIFSNPDVGTYRGGLVGRFIPDHFTVVGTVTNACTAGTFTYMGQDFTLSTANVVEARNYAGGVTANYAGVYAPGTVIFGAENADSGVNLAARLSVSAGNWAAGAYTLSDTNIGFSRPTTTVPDVTWGAFDSLDIGLSVTDADVTAKTVGAIINLAEMDPTTSGSCGTACPYKKLSGSGSIKMRFGRLKLSNAYGSELLDLSIPFRAEYWNNGWVFNSADSCTGDETMGVTNAVSVVLSAPPTTCVQDSGISTGLSGLGCTAAGPVARRFREGATPDIGFAGDFNLWLRTPGAGNTGAVTVTGNVPAWLQFDWNTVVPGLENPSSRATFGVYNRRNEFIYLRENY